MPPRHWRLFVADIVDAIQAIGGYTSGLAKAQLFDDRMRLDAVIEANPQIPWSRMRAMRNVVVHEYFGVDQDVLWGTVTDDLQPLLPLLAAIVADPPDG